MGRAGHAVFAFAALFFVEIFYGAASNSMVKELAFFVVGLVLIFLCAAARPGESVWSRFGVRGFSFFMLAIIVTREIFNLAKSHFAWETPTPPLKRTLLRLSFLG